MHSKNASYHSRLRSLVIEHPPPVASILLERGLLGDAQAAFSAPFQWARRAAAAKRLPVSWRGMCSRRDAGEHVT